MILQTASSSIGMELGNTCIDILYHAWVVEWSYIYHDWNYALDDVIMLLTYDHQNDCKWQVHGWSWNVMTS